MIKSASSLLLILLTAAACYSQTGSIIGTVIDTSEKKPLANAAVVILKKSDSTLVTFTRTNNHGKFALLCTASDSCIILITYPKYLDYADELYLPSGHGLNLDTISLTQNAVFLQEIIIHSLGAIRFKGDTTEFIADSFKVNEGATVEELLGRLPGLSVNSKGQITAQGKHVDKVLVDGEEFFGEDPTIATQNIAAKQVDKIQVFDTKTEQDDIKGIGGLSQSRTINIKLKDSARNGYFGKLEAGSDAGRLHNGRVMYNNFLGTRKISAFVIKSNTNAGVLGFDERGKLGIENDYEYDEIAGYYTNISANNDFSDLGLQGLPNAYSAGGLYTNKWNEERRGLNLSYNYNRLATTNESSTLRETLLPDTIFYNNENTNTKGLIQQHELLGKYDWQVDSMTTIKISSLNNYKTAMTSSSAQSEALDENNAFVNKENRYNRQNNTHDQSDNLIMYKQKFKKKGRLLMATIRYTNMRDVDEGLLQSTTQFYRGGALDSTSILDQSKTGQGRSETFGGKIIYSEPLNNYWNLVAEYSYSGNSSSSHKNTFEKDQNGKYTILDTLYSNNFSLNAYANAGAITFRYLSQRVKSTIGGGVSSMQLNVYNIDNNFKKVYNFTNFSPLAQINYAIKPQTALTFRYSGTTAPPSINELQPIRNNNDPLNVYIGNPNLKVGFNHDFSLSYNRFHQLKSQYTFFGADYTILQNAIEHFSVIDSFGKTTNKPVNVHGDNHYYVNGGWTDGQGEEKLIHEISTNISGGRSVTFINGQQAVNTYTNFSFAYSVIYFLHGKYNFNVSPRVGRSISRSSLRKDINNNYWNYGGEAQGSLTLPWNLELRSDVSFDLRQRIPAFANLTRIDIILWNAQLSKKVFKNRSGQFIFRANDILNQNKGFERVINSNFVTEQHYQTVGQYFMLSFQWMFNKMPEPK